MSKIHFGIMENHGDYEQTLIICETTLCGYTSEKSIENATDYWEDVTCKKCLNLKENYEKCQQIEEEHIVNQMGDMAEFFENWEKAKDCLLGNINIEKEIHICSELNQDVIKLRNCLKCDKFKSKEQNNVF